MGFILHLKLVSSAGTWARWSPCVQRTCVGMRISTGYNRVHNCVIVKLKLRESKLVAQGAQQTVTEPLDTWSTAILDV